MESAFGRRDRDDPVFSSKYIGLEKEVEYRSRSSLSSSQNYDHNAIVHEGKVRGMIRLIRTLSKRYCFQKEN